MIKLIIDDLDFDIELDQEVLADNKGGFVPIPYPNTSSRYKLFSWKPKFKGYSIH